MTERQYCVKQISINDEHKKNIANYDFIVSGYQVIKDDKILDKFVVSNCLRYEYVKKK